MPVYPPNDEWCEAIVAYDGYWTCAESDVILSDDRQVGNFSIGIPPFIPGYGISEVSLYFNFIPGMEFDFTNVYEMDLTVKLGDCIGENWCWEEGFDLYLIKDDNTYAKRHVFIAKEAAALWVPVVLETGPDAPGWDIVGDFDWTSISRIRFHFKRIIPPWWWPPPPVVGERYVRIDAILLFIKEVLSGLTVSSEPISVPVSLDTVASDYTPATWWFTPGVRTVTVEEEYGGYTFRRWDDGSTSPTRTVDATVPGVYRVTAYYEPLPKPPPKPPPTPWRFGYLIQYIAGLIRRMFGRRF